MTAIIGRFSQYQTAPVQSQKMRDQFSRNFPHSLRSFSSKTNADRPALDAPQALGTNSFAGVI